MSNTPINYGYLIVMYFYNNYGSTVWSGFQSSFWPTIQTSLSNDAVLWVPLVIFGCVNLIIVGF